MADRLSRRRLAIYVANQLESGADHSSVLGALAGLLVADRRQREAELMVRAIMDELASRGTVLATVTTASKLSDQLAKQIKQLIGADVVTIDSVVDPSVIGGVKIEAPGSALDATISQKLRTLSRAKI